MPNPIAAAVSKPNNNLTDSKIVNTQSDSLNESGKRRNEDNGTIIRNKIQRTESKSSSFVDTESTSGNSNAFIVSELGQSLLRKLGGQNFGCTIAKVNNSISFDAKIKLDRAGVGLPTRPDAVLDRSKLDPKELIKLQNHEKLVKRFYEN